jgi:hypothetical protein
MTIFFYVFFVNSELSKRNGTKCRQMWVKIDRKLVGAA